MASIINLASKEQVILNQYHVFGRNPSIADTIHLDPDVSQSHAKIIWKEGYWSLKDESTNGTLVDGEYLHQTSKKLLKKHIIQFGNSDKTSWQIQDLDPPFNYLKSTKKENCIIKLDLFHHFPNEESPEVTLHKDLKNVWNISSDKRTGPLKSQETITICEEKWIFVYNETIEDTVKVVNLFEKSILLFQLSHDEEKLSIQLIVSSEQTYDIKHSINNYILLALARKREQDNLDNLPEYQQGWIHIEDLAKDVSKEFLKEIDVLYLNLQIHRLRKQLMDVPTFGRNLASILPRNNGLIRLGHSNIQIIKNQLHQNSLISV